MGLRDRIRKDIKVLVSEADKLTKKSSDSYKDDRFWQPEVDKAGNGFAVIRFLPAVDGEDLPWVRMFGHSFQGPGGWYIENSLTTIGENDPVGEANNKLWNSGIESDKEIARVRKRKLSYIANILVVKDELNPQNEGKVFLYKFGKKIFDKICDSMNPEFDDEKPINPFDPWEGADFRLRIRNVAGYRNYDKSEFATPAPLFNGEEASIEKVWKLEYPLKEFTDRSNFKSYEELAKRFRLVVGDDLRNVSASRTTVESVKVDDDDDIPFVASRPTSTSVDEEETSALDYFERLAKE